MVGSKKSLEKTFINILVANLILMMFITSLFAFIDVKYKEEINIPMTRLIYFKCVDSKNPSHVVKIKPINVYKLNSRIIVTKDGKYYFTKDCYLVFGKRETK